MYRAYRVQNKTTQELVSLFGGVTYFDFGAKVGDRYVSLGVVKSGDLSTALTATSAYRDAQESIGNPSADVSNHLAALAASPSIKIGISATGQLVLYKTPTLKIRGGHNRAYLLSEIPAASIKAWARWCWNEGWMTNWNDGYMSGSLGFDPLYIERTFQAFEREIGFRPTDEPLWNGTTIMFPIGDATSNLGLYSYAKSATGETWMYIPVYGPTVPKCVLCARLPYWEGADKTVPYFDSFTADRWYSNAIGVPQASRCLVTEKRTAMLAAFGEKIRFVYRKFIGPESLTDAQIDTAILAMNTNTARNEGVPIYLGMYKLVGRPVGLESVTTAFDLDEIGPDVDFTNVVRARQSMGHILATVDRKTIKAVAADYRASLADEDVKVPIADDFITDLNSRANPMYVCWYGTAKSVSDAVTGSYLKRCYEEGIGSAEQFMAETFCEGVTYSDVDKAVKAMKTKRGFCHLDILASEQRKVFDDRALATINSHGVKLTFVCTAVSDVISAITAFKKDDVAVTEEVFKRYIGQEGVTYSATGATLNAVAVFYFNVANWDLVKASFDPIGTRRVDVTAMVYDSKYLTVDGYPDVDALDEAHRSTALIAYSYCESGILAQLAKISLFGGPQDEDYAD